MQKSSDSRSRRQNQLCLDIRNFRVINLIRKGGFSSVFYVEDENTKLQYAAKVITYNNDEEKYRTMINREIGIMIHAQHPTIIKFFGYSLKDFDGFPNVVIFMEYAAHGSVTELLQNARNSRPSKTIDNTVRQIILVGVARGMMHLHSHHIIHRDLKPDNVLIDEFYRPHITDFGLSKMYETGNSANQSRTCGTSIYKAPEVITNNQYSEKSDVYSFAIFMYEVLTEAVPYPKFLNNEMTEFNFNQKVVSDDFRPTFTVPIKKSLQSLIEMCWSKNPSDRPTFEDIFSRLAFNVDYTNFNVFENKKDENEEDSNSYYLDGVDIKKLLSYVDDINKTYFNTLIANSSNIIDELMKENEKIKNQLCRFEKNVTIDCFNHLPLESQQIIIFNILKSKTNEKEIHRYTKLNNLLLYLLNLFSSGEYNFIEIPIRSSDEQLCNIKEAFQYLNRIYFLTDAVEILYNTKSLNSTEFINHLQHFDDVSVEMKYPSKSFKHNYRSILNIKSTRIIKIVVYITGVTETDTAFKYDGKINCIKIGSSVTSIGDYSFDGCSGINQLLFSNNSLTSIGIASFHKCTSLTQITIPSSVTTIGSHAFRECSSLTQITIPSSVTSINEYAFSECSLLSEISIPPSINSIREYTFSGCSSLVKVSIPSSVTSIGESAFLGCSSLVNLTIPNSVVSIGIHAFERCIALSQISIPSSVKLIGGFAFSECSNLSQILIVSPSNLSSIDEYTFLGCAALCQVLIPNSVTSIEKCAFSGCSSLQFIVVPSSVESIGSRTFEQCTALQMISIPNSVSSIGEDAFKGCSALTQISIPASIQQIDNLGLKEIDKVKRT